METVKLLVRDALHQAPNISAPTGPVNPADSCIFVTVLYFPVFFCVLYFPLFLFFTALLRIFISFTHGTDYITKSFSVICSHVNILR